MDEMRNRMREMGVKECFDLLANPRLPFPRVISPKKTKKNPKQNQFPPHAHRLRERFFSLGSAQGAFREAP
jgi:hypothetical protein